ncbi:MAG: enolase C-terminal domain-like protein [Desulfurococcaceae archaeon]
MSERVERIDFTILRFPVSHFISGWRQIKETYHMITLVKTENHVIGIGEGTPYGTDIVEDYNAALKLRKILIGRTLDEAIKILNEIEFKAFLSKTKVTYGTFLAIEGALLDALAKHKKTSIANLLGGEYRDRVPVVGTVFLKNPYKMVEEVNMWILKGINHIKVKIPCNLDDLEKFLNIIVGRSLLKEGDTILRVDANQCFKKYEKAVKALKIMEKYGVYIVEQPMPRHALKDIARLRKLFYPTIKIMLDESLTRPQDIKLFAELEAADIVNFHPSKLGCLSITRHSILESKKYGLEAQIGSALLTEIGLIHYVNLAVSIPKLDYPLEEIGIYPFYRYYIYKEPYTLSESTIYINKYKNIDPAKLTFEIIKKIDRCEYTLFDIHFESLKIPNFQFSKIKLSL